MKLGCMGLLLTRIVNTLSETTNEIKIRIEVILTFIFLDTLAKRFKVK